MYIQWKKTNSGEQKCNNWILWNNQEVNYVVVVVVVVIF